MRKKSRAPRRILVIRFRQIGDAVLATALCSTLKRTFPEAEIHYVLNAGIAPLFEGHPDIDRVIPFAKDDNKPLPAYLRKIRRTMAEGHYDMIIDMRSTIRTLLFSLMSPLTPWRIGREKGYTRGLLNRRVENAAPELGKSRVERDLMLATPLEEHFDVRYVTDFTLHVTDGERRAFGQVMTDGGIDLSRPVIMAGVTAKLAHKRWRREFMVETLRRLIADRPDIQMIFNYAPGEEEAEARAMFEALGSPHNVKIDIEARSLRQLAAMMSCCSFYFGNEGGARHIAQALGVPSLAIFSPCADKTVWLPTTSTPAEGIAWTDVADSSRRFADYGEMADAVTPDIVYPRLLAMLRRTGLIS